jgi:prepilin-type N-terminal cleavage/methylation domain-containing protein
MKRCYMYKMRGYCRVAKRIHPVHQGWRTIMSSKGFTLIELMIVIGIIGTLSAVALFRWWGFQNNTNLRTAASEIMSDISSCKQRAVSEGVQYCIQFTEGSPNYTINASSCTSPTQTQTKRLTSFGSGLLISNTNFNSDQLGFLSRGTLSSNTGRITLTNSSNSTAIITVNITGRTYVSYTMR